MTPEKKGHSLFCAKFANANILAKCEKNNIRPPHHQYRATSHKGYKIWNNLNYFKMRIRFSSNFTIPNIFTNT